MSGGRFNYQDSNLKNDMFGWYSDKRNGEDPMEDVELSELVFDVLNLIHDLDWYRSDDTSEEDYLKSKNKFKDKWIRNENYDEVLKQIIKDEVDNLELKLLKSISNEGDII